MQKHISVSPLFWRESNTAFRGASLRYKHGIYIKPRYAPAIPGPSGGVFADDWCIREAMIIHGMYTHVNTRAQRNIKCQNHKSSDQ